MQHLIDKWDCYLAVLLGIGTIILSRFPNPVFETYFRYYIFLMFIAIAVDIFINFESHESAIWKFAAITSNFFVVICALLILIVHYGIGILVDLSFIPLYGTPNFLLFIGAALILENLMWIFVYDHF